MQWLMFGIAAGLFAVAFFASSERPYRSGWLSSLGWLSVLASIGALTFGTVQTWNGFTEDSMAAQTGLLFGVVWVATIGVFLYRHPERATGSATARRNVAAPATP